MRGRLAGGEGVKEIEELGDGRETLGCRACLILLLEGGIALIELWIVRVLRGSCSGQAEWFVTIDWVLVPLSSFHSLMQLVIS